MLWLKKGKVLTILARKTSLYICAISAIFVQTNISFASELSGSYKIVFEDCSISDISTGKTHVRMETMPIIRKPIQCMTTTEKTTCFQPQSKKFYPEIFHKIIDEPSFKKDTDGFIVMTSDLLHWESSVADKDILPTKVIIGMPYVGETFFVNTNTLKVAFKEETFDRDNNFSSQVCFGHIVKD